ncbi:hypothetical protein ACF061_25935 [Streptomyces sp. NPDC015220]|uniref:hypothetical protein n=1 Tax=Streptomyces sp. NPDC015220 TaxID=3364947 RepID=UPI0036FE9028
MRPRWPCGRRTWSSPPWAWPARPGCPGCRRPASAWAWTARRWTGDLGAGITSRLAEAHPEAVVGVHLLAAAAPAEPDPAGLTPEEETCLASVAAWQAQEGGHPHQQNTRPLTLAPALTP